MSFTIISLYFLFTIILKIMHYCFLVLHIRNQKTKDTELVSRTEQAGSGPSFRGLHRVGIEPQKIGKVV